MMAEGFPDPGLQKGAKVTVDRRPRRKCRGRRQVAPLAPRAHDMEQAVQHQPHIGRPGPTAGLGRGEERLDQTVLVIAQGLTGTKVPNPCTILGPDTGIDPLSSGKAAVFIPLVEYGVGSLLWRSVDLVQWREIGIDRVSLCELFDGEETLCPRIVVKRDII